jgi:biotin carboxyl carrier protein
VAALAAPAADPWQRGWRLSGGSQTVRLRYGDVTAAVVLRRVGPESWSAVVGPEESPVGVSRDGDGVRVERNGRGERIVVARLGEEIMAVVDGIDWRLRPLPPPDTAAAGRGGGGSAGTGHVHAPLTGTVVKIVVSEGEMVRARQPLVVIEAMKMEHTLTAPADAVVTRVAARPGDLVQAGAMLVELGDAAAGG